MLTYILVVIIAYCLGSISFSVIISKKMAGFDVREKGSKNAGSTNVLRTVGKKAAGITLLCDILKGVIAVLIAYILGLPLGILLKVTSNDGLKPNVIVYRFLDVICNVAEMQGECRFSPSVTEHSSGYHVGLG